MANGHGGTRPGAGRKPQHDVEYQTMMRGLIRSVVTPDDWRNVLAVRLSFALAGNADAYRDLEKWVMGKVPDQLNLGGADGGPVQIEVTPVDYRAAIAPLAPEPMDDSEAPG